MSSERLPRFDVGRRDVGFGLVWLLSFVLLLPAQLSSMILFDSTGLDVPTPDVVFMIVVPAIVVALLPTIVARRYYTRRVTLGTALAAFVACAALAAYLMQFYGLCGGPGC